MHTRIFLFFLVAISMASPIWAGNVVVLEEFVGDEPTMPISTEPRDTGYCYQYGPDDLPSMLGYRQAGTMQVSEAGQYRVLDLTVGWAGAWNSLDAALHVYDGPFDPANPAQNRVAEFNRSYKNWVNDEDYMQLQAGTAYTVIIQKACGEMTAGLGGFLIRGPGDISGVGFQTPDYNYGDWSDVQTPKVYFPAWGENYEWTGNFAYTASKTGYHYFLDAAYAWPDWGETGGTWAVPTLYSAPFDPQNPEANLYADGFGWLSRYFLTEGQVVYVVYINAGNRQAPYQTLFYPPGELAGLNRGVTGIYADPLKLGQGLLLEADEDLDFLFGALFTFEDGSVPSTQDVGASDQRWLTMYGSFNDSSTEADLKFENSTGGAFNQETPKASTDSEYGSGRLVAKDCEHIELHYSLPNTPDGVFELVRLLPGKSDFCYQNVGVAEPLH